MNRAADRSWLRQTARRGLVWLLILGLTPIIEAPTFKPAEKPYFWIISLLTSCLTILTYELYAHWLFPRYLYRGRLLWLTGLSIAVFALIYCLMYISYPLIQQTARIPETILTKSVYPQLNYWFSIYKAGMAGWLHTPRTIAIVLGTPYFFASPFLFVQLIRYYLNQRQNSQQTELDNLRINNENKLLELELLKAQLNPHFLFNSLNSIYVRIIDVDEEAADLVLRLAELMRYNLYEADAQIVTLDQELEYIENYLQLEQTRHGERIEILFSSEGDFSGLTIAPLILLAFVENAFKYGIGGTQQGAYVWVEAHLDQSDTLVFTVQNSLVTSGNRSAFDRQPSGVDLPNVRQRLALLYPEAHRIETEQSEDSYSISLFIQLAPVQYM
ncbi:histidine kinase [Spirosoma aureum]|uniref:Histidine kinase n=1 Tax=Spirosoma aureum TaxID=2692134 RepID=A0A6G9AVG6_9BACT|nr:sensor histidine kinase [Spirosoma aureum]QIP16329.1 histidine kinase [Spirosoma aureum]